MPSVNPVSPEASRSWRLLADRLAVEADERTRWGLSLVLMHQEREVAGDLPALMSTLIPEPLFRFFGSRGDLEGHDQIEKMYQQVIDSGSTRIEFVMTRVVADPETVVTEGYTRHAFRGRQLTAMGANLKGEDVEAEAWYLVDYPVLIVWPITPEGIVGEDLYHPSPIKVIRKLAEGEMPHLGPVGR